MEYYTILLYLYFVSYKLVVGAGLLLLVYITLKFCFYLVVSIEYDNKLTPFEFASKFRWPAILLVVLLFLRGLIPSYEQMVTLVTVEAMQRAATTEEARTLRGYLLKELMKLGNDN